MNFLGQRIRIEKEVDSEILAERQAWAADQQPQIHVIDRSIFEDNEIFAKNQLDSGMMTQEEYGKYLEVYLSNIDQIIKPDFVVILTQDVKVLHQRVRNRGREMEKDMSIEYLQNLQNRYDHALVPFLEKRGINYLKTTPDLTLDPAASNKKVLCAILDHLQLPNN
jgi:deoxyadenosine/deoxycytidine kinase